MISRTRWLAYFAIILVLAPLGTLLVSEVHGAVILGGISPTAGTVNIPVQLNAQSLVATSPNAKPITIFWDIGASPGAAVDGSANNGLWDQGEVIVYDNNTDNKFTRGVTDEPLVGQQIISTPTGSQVMVPDPQTFLKSDAKIKFVDGPSANGKWDPGETLVYDTDNNNLFSTGDVVINGNPPNLGDTLLVDSHLKFIDGDTSCATTATGSFCSAIWTFTSKGTFNIKAIAVDTNGLGAATKTGTISIQDPPQIVIDPPSASTVFPGSTFSVSIILGNSTAPASDIDAWEVSILFDKNIVTPMGVGPTGIPCGPSPACSPADYGASTPFDTYGVVRTPTLDDTIGEVIVGATFFTFPTVGPSGFGTLVQITFSADAPGGGTTSLQFVDVKLRSQASTQTITLIDAVTPSIVKDGSASVTGTLDFTPTSAFLNQPQTFIASATGGTLPYTFSWDFNNDGIPDATGPTATHTFNAAGLFPVALSVSDNSGNNGVVTKSVNVTQLPNAAAPVLIVPGNQAGDELSQINFSVNASDADSGQTVTITCNQCTSLGATFSSTPGNPASGSFSWTPTEAQGPGDYIFTFNATDNGSPVKFDVKNVTVHVNEVNQPPVLTVPGTQSVGVGQPVSFDVSATDADLPANTIHIVCNECAANGATFTFIDGNPATGHFSWTPPAQGSFTFTFNATDNGSPVKFDVKAVTVTVTANHAPVLSVPGSQTVDEKTALPFTVSATDQDAGQTVTLSCTNCASLGATFNPGTGQFSWTPTEAQGPGDYTFTFTATDNGSPPLTDTKTVAVHVNEVNSPPVLNVPGAKTIVVQTSLTFAINATDPDVPANTVSLSCANCVTLGATFNTSTGIFSWTPSDSQGPGDYVFTFNATDNGSPALTDTKTVTVTVTAATGTLRITVTNAQGNPIAGARVRLVNLPAGQGDPGEKTTASDGSVVFSNIAEGAYGFEVTADGYQTATGTARVTAGSYATQRYVALGVIENAPSGVGNYLVYIAVGVVIALLVALGLYLRSRSSTSARSP